MCEPGLVSVSSSWIQEQFRCCICLDVFRDPVCTPCGHNFCLDCIEGFWETKARPECPLCKEVFSCRPELRVNHSFADIIQHLLRNLPSPEVEQADSPDPSPRHPLEDLLCDVCSEAHAVRSCLVCQTSYCQLHVAPHLCDSVLRRHSLTDPASFPSPQLCRTHQRPLLLYCHKERTAVCESCGQREHKQHRTISVERATRRVKAAVKETKADLQRMIQDRVGKAEQIQQNLDQSKKQTQQQVEQSVRRWSLLLCALEQEQLSLVEKLQSRQKEMEEEAQQLLTQLQKEVKELQARGADIQDLESTHHSLHLIQSFPLLSKLPPTRDWDEVRVCSDSGLGAMREALSNMRDICQKLCSEVSEEEVDSLADHELDVTFDPDTASGWVEVSADGKKVNVRAQKKKLLLTDTAQRFDCCVCVLGKQQITTGRRYWVVEVGDKTDWEVGVARESVQRKGQIQVQPDSGFWSMCRRSGTMSACTRPSQQLGPQLAAPQRIGVFVDYERGLVSFYDAQRKTHLFSFTDCNLQGALCPYFNPCVQEDKRTPPLRICAVERGEERPEGRERPEREERQEREERDQREQRPEMVVTSL